MFFPESEKSSSPSDTHGFGWFALRRFALRFARLPGYVSYHEEVASMITTA